MPIRTPIAAAALALLAGTAVAAAASETVPLKANTAILLPIYTIVLDDCHFGMAPNVKVVTAPSHGRIDIAFRPFKIPEGETCHGVEIKARMIRYAPNRNFVGKDTAHVKLEFYNYDGSRIGKYSDLDLTFDVKK